MLTLTGCLCGMVLLAQDVQELVQLNSTTIGQLDAFRASVQVYYYRQDELQTHLGKLPPRQPDQEYVWSKLGEFERVSLVDHREWASRPNGEKGSRTDVVNGPRGYRRLVGFNPDRPELPTESKDWPVKGSIGQRKETPRYPALPRTDFHVFLDNNTGQGPKWLSLEQLLSQPGVKRPPESGDAVDCLRLMNGDFRQLLRLDLKAGGWIQSIESFHPQTGFTSESIITKFQQVGNWIAPSERLMKVSSKGVVGLASLHIVKKWDFAKALTERDFEVAYPEWTRVVDEETKRIYIWGQDGPKLTFNSLAEYMAWFESRRGPDPIMAAALDDGKADAGVWWRSPWLWLAVLGAAILLTMRRWRSTSRTQTGVL